MPWVSSAAAVRTVNTAPDAAFFPAGGPFT
jgi:hypothetical protein